MILDPGVGARHVGALCRARQGQQAFVRLEYMPYSPMSDHLQETELICRLALRCEFCSRDEPIQGDQLFEFGIVLSALRGSVSCMRSFLSQGLCVCNISLELETIVISL